MDEQELNFEEERAYWQKQLEAGDINAYYNLSRLCELEGKMDESGKYFMKAVAAGQADALYWLSRLCLDSESDFYDPDASSKYLRQAADGGCTDAMLAVGDGAVTCTDKAFYETRTGTADERAQHFVQFEWYKKAAEGGDAAQMLHIADAYWHGYPVPQNDERAFDWYMRGVEYGRDLACVCPAARCFELGRGVEADAESAVEFYEAAAGYGVQEAIRRLYEIYRDGLREVAPDAEKAAQYAALLEIPSGQ